MSNASIDRDRFFALARVSPFGGRLAPSQVEGLTHLLDVWEADYAAKHADRRFMAYALATAFHETGRAMRPVEEVGKGKGRPYGRPTGPWRQVYDGRGLVQLTWERNYVHAQARLKSELGIAADLPREPATALDPDIAAHILYLGMIEGWFTGRRLADYFGPRADDPLHARRIVNGLDRASDIAGYHRAFLAGLALPSSASGT